LHRHQFLLLILNQNRLSQVSSMTGFPAIMPNPPQMRARPDASDYRNKT
jgi:hypothetical protein